MSCIFPLVIVVVGQIDVSAHLPDRLQAVIESQRAETAEIEWTLTHLDEREYGLTERFVTRTAGDTLWQVNLGDEKGRHRTTYKGYQQPIPKEEVAGPYHTLLYEGDLWYATHPRGEAPMTAVVTPRERVTAYEPLDFAAAGIAPWTYDRCGNPLGLRPDQLEGFDSATVTRSTSGALEIIQAEYNENMLEWHLDKRRGGRPVFAAFYDGDTLAYSSVTDLEQIDGRWFPTSIKFYEQDSDEPYKIIRVKKASFDKPWHRRDMTPNDIGILFGTQLWYPDEGIRFWDGSRMLSTDEYTDLVYVYGLRPDPTIIKYLARASGLSVEEFLAQMDRSMETMRRIYAREHDGEEPWVLKKSSEPDEWDLYVAAFIRKHKLDKPRTKQANQLLRRSKTLRDYYRRKQREAEKKSEGSKVKRPKAEGSKVQRADPYEKMIKRIFDRILVRGLNKLVPDAKRRAG